MSIRIDEKARLISGFFLNLVLAVPAVIDGATQIQRASLRLIVLLNLK